MAVARVGSKSVKGEQSGERVLVGRGGRRLSSFDHTRSEASRYAADF